MDDFNRLKQILERSLCSIKPPPKLKPHEWAEQNIIIPAGNAIPGPLRFDNAPYQIEPLDCMADPTCHTVTLMWGAQTGKTNLINIAIGFNIDHNPVSQIMMQPTQNDVQIWLNAKFDPMLESCPSVKAKVAKPRGREGVNNQKMKSYPGGALMLSWAGAPTTQRGRSAPKNFNDEVDGYERTEEGHPVNLIRERSKTFGDQATSVITSTPTIKGESFVESSFLDGDQRYFYVPCPHCGHEQTLKWANIHWEKDDEGEGIPETAAYACEDCGCLIEEGHKPQMMRKGFWKAHKPFKGHASFHLNELYSLMSTWESMVRKFIKQKKEGDLRTFFNTSMAETWEETTTGVESEHLETRVEKYKAEVPVGVGVLTGGVDVQRNRIELEVTGWGIGYESWNIDHKVFFGDPLLSESDPKSPWYQLNDYRQKVYMHENGHQLSVAAWCIDSSDGETTEAVYTYCHGKIGQRIFSVKGRAGWNMQFVSPPRKVKIKRTGKSLSNFIVGVDPLKSITYARLSVKEGEPGYCHFPLERNAEYFKQLAAERLVVKYSKGQARKYWYKTRERNEAIDLRVYSTAALHLLQANLDILVKKLAIKVEADKPKPKPKAPRKTSIPTNTKRRKVKYTRF